MNIWTLTTDRKTEKSARLPQPRKAETDPYAYPRPMSPSCKFASPQSKTRRFVRLSSLRRVLGFSRTYHVAVKLAAGGSKEPLARRIVRHRTDPKFSEAIGEAWRRMMRNDYWEMN